uniref:Uncharacterized protein n=1 Tax=Branchiostoma floridae TaxID=7739 RepID=C3YZY8_BRAFL|eukprot:XP_002598397.1 hypothetical protein BRAFLDRAFT_96877 [Branchiostoma floridae]
MNKLQLIMFITAEVGRLASPSLGEPARVHRWLDLPQASVHFCRRTCSCSPMTGPAAGSRRLLSANLLVFTYDCLAADSRRLLSANQLAFTDGWFCRRLPSTSLGEPARVHRLLVMPQARVAFSRRTYSYSPMTVPAGWRGLTPS